MNEIETFYGLVENTLDALRIFQMCRDGRLSRVRRRLHERERRLIRSGSVFVFDEEESGIRRWTDGRLWSPSRILGNFLIYRELEKKGHRTTLATKTIKSSLKKPFGSTRILPKATESLDMLWGMPRTESSDENIEDVNEEFSEDCYWMFHQPESNNSTSTINPQDLLKSSLTDKRKTLEPRNKQNSDPTSGESLRVLKSRKLTNNHKGRYIFKSDGFIKKTISIQLEGHTHHLVAYYSLEDFCRGHLQLNEALQLQGQEMEMGEIVMVNKEIQSESHVSQDQPFDPQLMEILRQVPIPIDLMLQQNFRKPAALLASATSNAQNLGNNYVENGEKLITALEYGAINPSDLQVQSKHHNNLQSNSHKQSHAGLIFTSSSSSNECDFELEPEKSSSSIIQRSRRHSSFHPFQKFDESNHLTGEALEFLSNYSDDPHQFDNQNDLLYPPNSGNIFTTCVDDGNDDLETELFGSILSSSPPQNVSVENLNEINPNVSMAIKGFDVLLSDVPK